jgi:hypothetical protein
MANSVNYLSQIQTGQTIQAVHVNQFVYALTGSEAYNIYISGSLTLTGSVASLNGFTGSLKGTADTGSKANNILISNFGTTDKIYRLAFVDPASIPSIGNNFYNSLIVDSGSDGSGLSYNPSTNSLTSSFFVGDLIGTSSHSITSSVTNNYIPGTANFTTIYPQGTIYTKFENVLMSQSLVQEYDLLAATLTFTGNRDIPTPYVQANTTGEAKIIKFYIKGFIGDTNGLGTPSIESYVKIGNTTLNSTKLGVVTLSGGADETPFEIEYELVFSNNTVNACGGFAFCKNADYEKYPLSNLYQADPAPAIGGDLQFIISGSSALVITGSLAHIEFIN